jgi:hypothetical protein
VRRQPASSPTIYVHIYASLSAPSLLISMFAIFKMFTKANYSVLQGRSTYQARHSIHHYHHYPSLSSLSIKISDTIIHFHHSSLPIKELCLPSSAKLSLLALSLKSSRLEWHIGIRKSSETLFSITAHFLRAGPISSYGLASPHAMTLRKKTQSSSSPKWFPRTASFSS